MLCRSKVSDFAKWLQVFSSHKKAHVDAGLILEHLWQACDNPDQIFYLFRVDDVGKAEAFISAPDAARAARTSGVVDGEYHFVNSAEGY
jgi:hypothetical protein